MKTLLSSAAGLLLAVAGCCACAAPPAAQAAPAAPALHADYPHRAIRLVIPFAPGLVTDATARLLAERMQAMLGQPIVAENKPGAQGALGSQQVAASPADGYTLLVATVGTHAANPSLFRKLSYDPLRDFAPVGLIGTAAWALVVRADDPTRTLDELLARMRQRGGDASAGYFSAASQVCISLLNQLAGTRVLPVPYKGNTEALTDLVGGRLDFGFLDIGTALAQQQGGRVRLLAVTSRDPAPLAPQLPTLASRLPGYEIVSWSGLVAPAGTPAPVVRRLHEALERALAQPDLRRQFEGWAFEPVPGSSESFRQRLEADGRRWSQLVRDAGIEAQ